MLGLHVPVGGWGCWGGGERLQPRFPSEPIPNECDPGVAPQPQAPTTGSSSRPGDWRPAPQGSRRPPPDRAHVVGGGAPPRGVLASASAPSRPEVQPVLRSLGCLQGQAPGRGCWGPGLPACIGAAALGAPAEGKGRFGGPAIAGARGQSPGAGWESWGPALGRGGAYRAPELPLPQAFAGVSTQDWAGTCRRRCGWARLGVEGLEAELHGVVGQLPWVRVLATSSGAGSVGSRPSGRGPPGTSGEKGQGLGARGWVSGRDSSRPSLRMGSPCR